MQEVIVTIQPEIIKWALDQTPEYTLDDNLMQHIREWLNGTEQPTFRQIEEFSRQSNIPLGYFFLKTPPAEELEILSYRTVDSDLLVKPSRVLIDTIYKMEEIQDWMIQYRKDYGYEQNQIVGWMKHCNNANDIVVQIRSDLALSDNWQEECTDCLDAFLCIKKKLEACGVLVLSSGIASDNIRRSLNAEEFRAFAFADNWSPLICINSAYPYEDQLFALLHEIVYLWIGTHDFYNIRDIHTDSNVKSIEQLCNALTYELLIPEKLFLQEWDALECETAGKVDRIAMLFHCGKNVAAGRAYDSGKINTADYCMLMSEYLKNDGKCNRDNCNISQACMLDNNLISALRVSIAVGRTSYSEAYRLTDTDPNTFQEMLNAQSI